LPTATAKQEWGIADDDYEYVLKIIRHVGATFGRTRRTYSIHDEEELRDILLAHLNGHLEGAAHAEAFSKRGKTDLIVEYDNRAAFIAECKVWRGEAEFVNAITQLFSYATWRDYKTALIVFNKHNMGFTSLREKVSESLRNHPQTIRELAASGGGEWRFELSPPDDLAARVLIHVFMFDLYMPSSTAT
jgi:hypothetical protein